jgi:hypothetical protein
MANGNKGDDSPTLLDLMLRESGHGGTPTPASAPAAAAALKSDFGSGLRRGFLFDRPPRRRKQKQQPQQQGIPTSSSLVLPEVQAAMDRGAKEAREERARGGE